MMQKGDGLALDAHPGPRPERARCRATDGARRRGVTPSATASSSPAPRSAGTSARATCTTTTCSQAIQARCHFAQGDLRRDRPRVPADPPAAPAATAIHDAAHRAGRGGRRPGQRHARPVSRGRSAGADVSRSTTSSAHRLQSAGCAVASSMTARDHSRRRRQRAQRPGRRPHPRRRRASSVRVLEAADTLGGGARSARADPAGAHPRRVLGLPPARARLAFARDFDLACGRPHAGAGPRCEFSHPARRRTGGAACAFGRGHRRRARRRRPRLAADSSAAQRSLRHHREEFLQPVLHVPRHPLHLARFGAYAALPGHGAGQALGDRRGPRPLRRAVAAHAFRPLRRAGVLGHRCRAHRPRPTATAGRSAEGGSPARSPRS